MARLVDDLLDFSRLEQDRLQLERREVAVAEVLGRLVETFRGQPSGERIVAELPDGLIARLDPERLTQMVSNLLVNALRYAPSGPIVLRATRRDGDLVVEVVDRGPGLSPAERSRVWETFYRGESALTSPNRGSGLGLAMVKHLTELHGGTVGIRGTQGGGATFWFRIPTGPPESR
jgi:signal transduction histidine kinase